MKLTEEIIQQRFEEALRRAQTGEPLNSIRYGSPDDTSMWLRFTKEQLADLYEARKPFLAQSTIGTNEIELRFQHALRRTQQGESLTAIKRTIRGGTRTWMLFTKEQRAALVAARGQGCGRPKVAAAVMQARWTAAMAEDPQVMTLRDVLVKHRLVNAHRCKHSISPEQRQALTDRFIRTHRVDSTTLESRFAAAMREDPMKMALTQVLEKHKLAHAYGGYQKVRAKLTTRQRNQLRKRFARSRCKG